MAGCAHAREDTAESSRRDSHRQMNRDLQGDNNCRGLFRDLVNITHIDRTYDIDRILEVNSYNGIYEH